MTGARIRYEVDTEGGTGMQILTTSEIAELLGRHRGTVSKMIQQGDIPGGRQINRGWVIPATHLPVELGVILWERGALEYGPDTIMSVNTASSLGVRLIAVPDPDGELVVGEVTYSVMDVEPAGAGTLRHEMIGAGR